DYVSGVSRSDPSSSCMRPPPPRSPLFPYTTLFRSPVRHRARAREKRRAEGRRRNLDDQSRAGARARGNGGFFLARQGRGSLRARSEEHTSELQSLRHLVCRLLLEKKKTRR